MTPLTGRMRQNSGGGTDKQWLTEENTDPLVMPLLSSLGLRFIADLRDTDADRNDHIDLAVMYKNSPQYVSMRIRTSRDRHWDELTQTSTHVNGEPGEVETGKATLLVYGWVDCDRQVLTEVILADLSRMRELTPDSRRRNNGNGQRFWGWKILRLREEGIILAQVFPG